MSDSSDHSAAPEGVRLQKLMAAAGVASRRVSEDMIAAGRVEVNGEVVDEPGRRVSETDRVAVDGVAIQLDTTRRYLMLNKPVGIVSSLQDERGRPDLQPLRVAVRGAAVQRGPPGRADLGPAHPHQRRRTRPRARASVVRRHEDLHREGGGPGVAADDREADLRCRAGGRADRGGQGADRGRGIRSGDDRGGHPALRTQSHRATDARRGRPSGDRPGAPPVRPAPPRHAGARASCAT